ncbi:MAG: PSD1 domain-containing protein, partial [Planctomycetales bacterium]|nr:PSD1 domain-containing protein [Planctomycetales bacterium]
MRSMKPSSFRSLKCIVTAWMLGGCSLLPAKADEPADAESALAGIEYFETHVRPLLEKHCYECHSESSRPVQGGLRLDDRQLTRRGGDSGPAVVPEDLDASLMLSALRYEDYEMPPNGQLSAAEIAAIEQWIRMGAPDPRRSSADPADEANSDQDALSRWAYVTPRRHPRPQVTRVGWPTTTIDWFVLQQMESMELSPAREADRRTLIRRATYDLIGLPPNPDRVDAFVQDESPQAYERLVDELLASPQYGERWTRLWLDVARYAEDQAHIVGDDRSLCYPNAYLYRDWVIGALNADVPYDEFVTQQLAADLLPDNERNHAALGFLGLGPKYYNRGSAEVKADEWDDRIDTVTRGLLGLTAACARCHDHKFDPITMRDYYALAGVFASTRMYNCALDATRKSKDDGNTEKPEDAMHIVREGKPTDVAIAIRGDVKKRGPVVPRGFLAVLHDGHSRIFVDGSGRLELARAITDPANPLTARVLVNRAWAAHFGRGIVATPSNFGQMGQTPTHPELLDDLATRFVEQGWSLKWLHREIVLSSTYRQSSTASAEQQAKDPNNVWLSRMHRRRLDIEQWRDAMLAVTNR